MATERTLYNLSAHVADSPRILEPRLDLPKRKLKFGVLKGNADIATAFHAALHDLVEVEKSLSQFR
jgi:hypothetical protein